MGWPPQVGEKLPRAAECWYDHVKLDEWVLGRGHGAEWRKVFGDAATDRDRVWQAIALAALGATVIEVRDRASHGITCGTRELVVLDGRSSPVTVSWHYASPNAAPRLATAYPSP